MTNPETHRQFYLAAAGIRMWYAKRPLPGAAPSPDFQFPVDDPAGEPTVHDEPAAIRQPHVRAEKDDAPVSSRSVDLQSLMTAPAQAREESPVLPELPETAPEPAPPAGELPADLPASHSAVAAHLGFWPTEKYLLISQWSDEASERLQDSLAENVLKALHQRQFGERQMVHWPVFRNPNIPGNSVDDFREVLSRTVSLYENRSIILLGVLSGEQDELRHHCLRLLLPRVGVDFACSLAELSASPGQKRDFWNALKSCYSV